jgi:tRNA A-37 threonylcarbamoyl transferase component Bud32
MGSSPLRPANLTVTASPTPMTSTTSPPSDDARGEPDLTGRQLGDYQILRRLGRGGMAEVYLAEQLSLRRQVAIKVLRRTLAQDEAYVRRFQYEARAAAKLVHANIVAIYEVGNIDGWHYIAQEYVPGQNLKQLITRLGRGLEAPQAVTILRQVSAALQRAAEQNITHRDIKPENIMLASTGEVKVADFGLARVAQAGESLQLTQVGITMGTPLYMSPEQVEGKEVDPRSDLYSLGVTAYHMLAGRPPFDGETALAVAVQHLKQEPERLEGLRPDLPPGLCSIVHRLLGKSPSDRYQRAVDVLRDLKAQQIVGDDAEWGTDLHSWGSAAGIEIPSGRLEATQQLGKAMQRELAAAQRGGWQRVGLGAVLVALAAAIGLFAAWISTPAPLLALPAGEVLDVPLFATVREQYAYGMMTPHDREEALLAVSRFHPPQKSADNLRYSRLATKALAAEYLASNRLIEARRSYLELAAIDLDVEPAERGLKFAGIAGCAVVYDRLGEEDGCTVCLVQLYELDDLELNQLGDTLRSEVQRLFEKYPRPAE